MIERFERRMSYERREWPASSLAGPSLPTSSLATSSRATSSLAEPSLARLRSPPLRFDYITWMRLDLAWEVNLAPALPLALPPARSDAIWLPEMNSQQGGLCDKFAFGTRNAMRFYLNRLDLVDLNYSAVPRNAKSQLSQWACASTGGRLPKQVCTPKPFVDVASACTKVRARRAPNPAITRTRARRCYAHVHATVFMLMRMRPHRTPWDPTHLTPCPPYATWQRAGCMISLNSERFLAFALYRANLTVVRMRWAFCKFGNSTHAWGTCTRRLRRQVPPRRISLERLITA